MILKFLLTWAGRLGLTALPGGNLLWTAVSAAGGALKWLWGQFLQGLADCLANPRVFMVVGLALVVGNWHGHKIGYEQGAGDLKTYIQTAEIYQQQADATADQAKAARLAAEKAEQAKIAAETLKAEADRKAAAAAAELAAERQKAADLKKRAKAPRARKTPVRAVVDPWSAWVVQIFGGA